MGIITGYITLVLLLFLLLKFVAKHLKWERINRALMRSHKYFALAFLIFALLHFFLVLKVLEGRMLIVTISGIIILVVGIALIVNDIIARQKIDVDVVTHATNSSNVIKQACINALME